MSDILSLVTDATEPKVFSIMEAIKGRSYPQDIVTVYTDTASAYKARELEKQINDATDNDELEALVAEKESYKLLVQASGLTFRLRGIDPGLTKRIRKEAEAKFPDSVPETNLYSNLSLIAAHIVDVTDADGAVDATKWDHDAVEGLMDLLPDDQFDKITQLMWSLSFSADLFDASVTPDFS